MVRSIAAVEKQQHLEKLRACERVLLLVCIPVCRLAPEAAFSANMDVNNTERCVGSGVSDSVYFDIHVCVYQYILRYRY